MYALMLGICLATSPHRSYAVCAEPTDTLELFNACQVLSSTPARTPKPLSLTAENVTVITRAEIDRLNAHTLTDVLDAVSGLQIQRNGGPGGYAYTYIQSASPHHLLVMIDGVSLDNINNDADTGIIPARIIERIEIVKGSASSSWGQALGGVINVITVAPPRRLIGGTADAAIGKNSTNDGGANVGGTSGTLGYLLSGGRLGSAGLLPYSKLDSSYIYGKLRYQLPGRGYLGGTLHYSGAERENLYVPQRDIKNDIDARYLYATLQLQRPLTDRLELEVKGHYARRNLDSAENTISDGSTYSLATDREKAAGLMAQLVWRGDNNLLVAGTEFEHKAYHVTDSLDPATQLPNDSRNIDRYGVFVNDTITIGPVAVMPGVRFDSLSFADHFSPSMGVTWQVTDQTLLRGYTAHGYSAPRYTKDEESADILTSQIGAESLAIPGLWLKGTLFRNDTGNVRDIFNQDTGIPERRIALGSELELRTVPVWNTSLGTGWTYTDTHRTGDGTTVYGLPRHTVQLLLRYDDKTYRGTLTGRHVWWHSNPDFDGRYAGLTWDLYLGAKLYKQDQTSLELFFSGHNLFNTAQYPDTFTPNTGRWFDGGVKVKF